MYKIGDRIKCIGYGGSTLECVVIDVIEHEDSISYHAISTITSRHYLVEENDIIG